LAYDLGLIDTGEPFEVARAKAHINGRANRLAQGESFSESIRK
jgi:hypothetical protein